MDKNPDEKNTDLRLRRSTDDQKAENVSSLLPLNKTYLVIIFSPRAKISTVEDVEKIVQQFGMLTSLEVLSKTEKILYISATTDTLLKLADEAELMKKTTTGSIQKFNYFSKEDFLLEGMTEDDILLSSDKPVLIKDTIKSELQPYFRNGVIEKFFPLHDRENLEKISINWKATAPIEDVRNYFGPSIGLYFAFVESYTFALIFPAVFGILQYILSFNLTVVCWFYVLWTTIFCEMWKRRCSRFTYRWGTIEMTSLDTPRSAYHGELKPDPVTGKPTLQYPMRWTYIQMYCVSYPVVLICVISAAYFSLYQFQIEAEVIQDFGKDSNLLYIPVIVQSILIAIFSWAYEKLATFLTDQENHRTRSQYERHRVNKLMLFEIVNNFFSLFYIAFVIQDLNQLKYQLMMQLVIFQIAQWAMEVGFPFIGVVRQNWNQKRPSKMAENKRSHIVNTERYNQATYESGLDEYHSTYEDYLIICTQFGYVVLFAAVAPFASLCALLSNHFEMYVDMFKLAHFYKRPFARRVKNIGAWQTGFEILSVMALLSNCGLLYLQPNIQEFVQDRFPKAPILAFIVFEHVLLGIKFCMHKAIHDKPRSVRIALAKADYESSLALKQLRKLRAASKKML